jgi:hypothetical protein
MRDIERSRSVVMTEHSKRAAPNQLPLTACATERNPPRAAVASPHPAKDSARVEAPSLEVLRGKLLPVIPDEYFEPPRPRFFGWLRRRRPRFVAHLPSSADAPLSSQRGS